MNIHYYMQYFPGFNSPGSMQPVTLSRFLAEIGHKVTVVAAHTNIDTGLREEPVDLSFLKGGRLRVLRLPCLSGGRGSNIERLKAYLSFMAIGKIRGLLLPRPDVIIGSIQPLFTGLAALAVAKIKKTPLVLEVRDLWPDALEVKGAVTGWKIKPLYWMANKLYRNADRIVSLTPGIKKELIKKSIDPSKIDVFPNGFDPRLFELDGKSREEVRRQYGWGTDFVAIYTGSFTEVTAVDVIIRAANILKGRRDIRFELFGKGPARDSVRKLAQELGLENVSFHDPVPKHDVPGLLAAADVALMCLFRSPLIHIYFENKFIDYMGAAKPILAAMEGEQAEIIRRYQTGYVVSTFDYQGLASLVAKAADDYSPFAEMGQNGRRFVHEKFLLPSILNHYAAMLESIVAGKTYQLSESEPI